MKLDINFYQDKFSGIFSPNLIKELHEHGTYVEMEAGGYLMKPGGLMSFIPILLEGSIKIMRQDHEGKEVLLYYIGGLDSCAMSLTCCQQGNTSEIIAQVEENVKLISIPSYKVDEWLCQHRTWKTFVFNTYQKRFEDMLETIDSIAFHKLDQRLLDLIKKKIEITGGKRILYATHEELANELATSREVVSRLLKQLEKLDRVKLSRNKLELLAEK
ncbi:Crp/Fnr family transcriptional regulator [uncultured Arcticibacterium sp.]|uniref:Crp/Fnr family transcriptional regulator n=1 Tax=uncultured Arcticibacterium sp. TaxID=2173042 RepID=UPI0030FCA057